MKYRTIFFGTPEFAVPSLESLIQDERFQVVGVVTQADKPVGRKQTLTPSPVKMLAIQNNIPVFQPSKLKGNINFWEEISLLYADVNMVVAYGKILPEQILDSAQKGSVNVHGSELPKYRGASPIHASILNGDKTTRFTIQKMVFAMDEGPILAMGPVINISDQDTYTSLSLRMAESVKDILPDVLYDYLEGKIDPVEQDSTKASYVSLIKKEDGKIDWQRDELDIDRMIRAYTPWPGSFTYLDDNFIKILSAEYVPTQTNAKGIIADIDGELYIGKLRIDQLQLAGRNPMAGRDFLRGYSKYVGHSMV